MTLEELISALEQCNPETVVPRGFHHPHSWRGDYAQLAFEPAKDVTVGSMLACAKEALGSTYVGYKGGHYVMDAYSDVYLAGYSTCGEELGPSLLEYMLWEAEREELLKLLERREETLPQDVRDIVKRLRERTR